MDPKPRIAIVPSPGMGHLIPLVEFASKLVLQYEFSVTFIICTTGSALSQAQKSALEILPQAINYILLPPVSFDDLPQDTRIQTKLSLTITRSIPSIRDAISSLVATSRLVSLVTDHFGTDAFDVANEFDVPPYLFFTSSALQLSFLLFELPELDKNVACEYRDMPEPFVNIKGFSDLVHASDLPDPVQDRKNDAYKWFLHNAKQFVLAEGIIVNSFVELGAGVIKALQEKGTGKPLVYPIGPITRICSSNEADGSYCLRWLDNQPSNSVLFVSFGSGGTLSYDQLSELALGLELSEQKFIWVVKSPDEKSASGSYFSIQSNRDPLEFLPEGFLDRTKGRQGLVVPSWAPQIEILGHGSTGGFLTHCGWNSIVESVVYGVPLIAWPLFAEQKLNAVMVSEDLKVALRPKVSESNGLVGREEIARVVKCLIQEGELIRDRMNRLKEAAAKALGEEGSSTKSLSELVLKWNDHKKIYIYN